MKRFKGFSMLAVIFILAAALITAGCGNKQEEKKEAAGDKEKFKVAFMYVGPVGDGGYTYAHDQGRQYLVEKMNDVQATIVESVPDTNAADPERELTRLAEEGNKVIFATSFGYMDPTINVAKKYPDVVFMHCSGFKTSENVGTYFGRMYQARYLTGIVAGKTTQSNLIGYVGAYPIPKVVRGINAFTQGVRSVNPKAKVKVVWTNTWYDPPRKRKPAKHCLTPAAM